MFLNGNTGDLGVKGKVTAEEVKVKVGGWSDFVFEKGYKLSGLLEVEGFISVNGHLKDIPNEEEVVVNGIELGVMDAKLLQKIEELFLYTISQEKKIKELNNTNTELLFELKKQQQRISELEKKFK